MTGGAQMALVINAGSSSLKYGLFQVGGQGIDFLCSGLCDKIGLDGSNIKHIDETTGKSDKVDVKFNDHEEALKKVVEMLTSPGGLVKNIADINVVGHRVVHGGSKFSDPAIVDDATEKEIENCIPLAPLHNPANLLGIQKAKLFFPSAKQVAVFDTAFHATMPPESYRYALPKELYEKYAVRRYGFHGTSYKYVTGAVAQALCTPAEELNLILCHLGNGASMACVRHGKVIDTTMGLTPLEGLIMGTRSGDLDAGVYTYLCSHVGMSPKDVDTLLNKKSGLLGLSGRSDMRDNIKAATEGEKDAQLARALYVERVRKYIGAFLVKLGGDVDCIVFTAGVGENDRALRELALANLQHFGIEVDAEKNQSLQGNGEVQTSSSRVKVIVMATQEELSIAQQSLEVCGILEPGSSTGEVPFTPANKEGLMPSKQFMRNITAKAMSQKQSIVLPEGDDPRIVKAAGILLARGLCSVTILGKKEDVTAIAKKQSVSLHGAEIVDPTAAPIDDMIDALCEARREQGMTSEQAQDLIRKDRNWFGTMMMHLNKIDGMVSGAATNTADTLRPGLQVIKAAHGVSQISSVFFMLLNEGVRVFADCGLVIQPGPQQLAEIALHSANTARAFGVNPKIAMLSYVTGSDSHALTHTTREATIIAKKLAPQELIEGPIQYDAAINTQVAAVKFKGKEGPVAGKASVLIFPDLNSGNITYKATQQAAKCIAIGPIMQGFNKPINDLSRGCTVDDIVATVIVTCVQSIASKMGAPSSRL